MPTQAELNDLQQDADDLQAVMVAALVAHWSANVPSSPADSVDELQEFVLDLVSDFGQAAGSIAVDFYDSVRPAGAPSFSPIPVFREDLLGPGTLNWATAPLQTETWDDSLDRLAAAAQKATAQALIETIGEATLEDPLEVKYARFPQNDDPCAYCVLRASRGAIYWTQETATRGDHIKCQCHITPVFSDEPLPYLRAPYMAKYLDGASAAEDAINAIRKDRTLSPAQRREAEFKALLAGMRKANGLR